MLWFNELVSCYQDISVMLMLMISASHANHIPYNCFLLLLNQRRDTEQRDGHQRGTSCFCEAFELIQRRGQESSSDIIKDDQRIL